MHLNPGQVLNTRYSIVSLLGQGGFGAVYRAWDLNRQVTCAIKENTNSNPESVRQFEREAKFLSVLHHPSLPRVIDHFTLPDQGQYLVMDFIDGYDLESMCNKTDNVLSEASILNWIGQICSALDYMHSQNPPIIHRDIKPANIIIRPDGTAVLVDFGIAKSYLPNSHTTHGARGITPGFSPPEQYGQGQTDQRTDIYALGATAYKLLTRCDPPESVALLRGVARTISLRTLTPKISLSIASAVERAMQLDPELRFSTASEFHAALSTPEIGTKISPINKKRFPWGWVAVGAAALLVLLIGISAGAYLILSQNRDTLLSNNEPSVRLTSTPKESLSESSITAGQEPTVSPTEIMTTEEPIEEINSSATPLPLLDVPPQTFTYVEISLWPEYDRTAMLVIFRFTLAADTSWPADLTIRIPASVGEPYAIANRSPEGSLMNISYNRQVYGDWAAINFSTQLQELQLEYYDNSLNITGTDRSFNFIWPVDYSIDHLSMQVQQPFDATNMFLSPSLDAAAIANDGLTYYSREFGKYIPGQVLALFMAYNKPTDTLSANR